jgi:hypothetical protein
MMNRALILSGASGEPEIHRGRRLFPAESAGRSGFVEELLGTVRLEPPLEDRQVLRTVPDTGQRHLVRPPRPGHAHTVDFLRPGPALRGTKDDQRPDGPGPVPLAVTGGR